MSGVLPKRYKTVKELGRGGFGTVYLAQDLSADGSLVAIKVIDTRQVNPKYISQEVMVHMSARHAQIVPVLEIHNLPDDYMAIVMEYIAGGDLLTYVQTKRQLPEHQARWIFQQLMYAVLYLHQKVGAMHRDIKLENILVDDASSDFPNVFLTDFGFAKFKGENPTLSLVGTEVYLAPEIEHRRDVRRTKYDGQLADIWSCGVCLYVMIYGVYPRKRYVRSTVTRTANGAYDIDLDCLQYPIPDTVTVGGSDLTVSHGCLGLLRRMMAPNPVNRCNLEHIWRDAWFLKDIPREVAKALSSRNAFRRR